MEREESAQVTRGKVDPLWKVPEKGPGFTATNGRRLTEEKVSQDRKAL